jgi:hypothetical protein
MILQIRLSYDRGVGASLPLCGTRLRFALATAYKTVPTLGNKQIQSFIILFTARAECVRVSRNHFIPVPALIYRHF